MRVYQFRHLGNNEREVYTKYLRCAESACRRIGLMWR